MSTNQRKDRQEKGSFSFQNKEQELDRFVIRRASPDKHITVPLQSTIGTTGVAAIEPARADVCISRYHRGAQTQLIKADSSVILLEKNTQRNYKETFETTSGTIKLIRNEWRDR